MRDDVIVVGDGPAGLALAAACADAAVPTALVSVQPGAPWPATYGVWVDELTDAFADDAPTVLARRWERPHLATDLGGVTALDRAYGLLDNAALQTLLRDRLRARGGVEVTGRAIDASMDAGGAVLTLDDGRTLAAGLLVDATGHRPVLARPAEGPPPAWQTAYGVVARTRGAALPEGGMWFMDWRTVPGVDPNVPTFLYAMDLGDGWTLLEETALAARPAVGLQLLAEHLDRRLAALGVEVVEVRATEHVAFPMGGPLPAPDGGVLAFGAAAGMVHPATGYQVGAALRRAPQVAAGLAQAIQGAGSDRGELLRAAREAIWPPDLLRQRALHRYGLEVLLALDRRELQRFFSTFFAEAGWPTFVSEASSSADVARFMGTLARRLPAALRWRLLRPAIGRPGPTVARSLLRPTLALSPNGRS